MIVARALAPLTALILAAASPSAQIVLEPQVQVAPAPATIFSTLTSGDFDEDGLMDVATLSGPFAGTLELRTSNGDGSFAVTASVASVLLPNSMAAVDATGDGHLDVVALKSILPGDGAGGLGPAISFPGGGNYVTAGLLDGDALTDLVAIEIIPFTPDSELRVLHANGDGTFTIAGGFITGLPRSLGLGDFDEDGNLDLLLVQANLLRFHSGLPGGLLDPFSTTLPVPAGKQHVLADLDDDGHLDIALTRGGPDDGVSVLLGNGDGTFAPRVDLLFGDEPQGLAVSDLDLDGALDLAAFSTDTSEIHVLRGVGDGSFVPDVILSQSAPSEVIHPAVGLVDDDAFPDLVFLTLLGEVGGLALVRNHTYGPDSPWADLGGDLPGTAGYPVFLASGELLQGLPFKWNLGNATPGAWAYLVVGFTAVDAPFKGGTLVPDPGVVLGPFVADPVGRVAVQGIWPALVGGYDMFFQYWIQDAGGPFGFAASTGVRASVPSSGGAPGLVSRPHAGGTPGEPLGGAAN